MSIVNDIFIKLCKDGKLNKVKEFYANLEDKIDITAENNEAFRVACMNGHIDIVK